MDVRRAAKLPWVKGAYMYIHKNLLRKTAQNFLDVFRKPL